MLAVAAFGRLSSREVGAGAAAGFTAAAGRAALAAGFGAGLAGLAAFAAGRAALATGRLAVFVATGFDGVAAFFTGGLAAGLATGFVAGRAAFTGALFAGALFTGADLAGADLAGADLAGADFAAAGFLGGRLADFAAGFAFPAGLTNLTSALAIFLTAPVDLPAAFAAGLATGRAAFAVPGLAALATGLLALFDLAATLVSVILGPSGRVL